MANVKLSLSGEIVDNLSSCPLPRFFLELQRIQTLKIFKYGIYNNYLVWWLIDVVEREAHRIVVSKGGGIIGLVMIW